MTEETQAPVTTPDQAASLNVADIITITNLIQAVAQRGAIRPDEMTLVGGVHDKLIRFLTAAGVLKPAVQEEAAPAAEEVTEK
jgi:hypothetical protein